MKIKTFILSLLFFNCSCSQLNHPSSKVITFEYDNKSILLQAPQGYCFYDENKPVEKDVVKLLRAANPETESKIYFTFQKCEEKEGFLSSQNPLFRDTGMIDSYLPRTLKDLKRHRLETSREVYTKFYAKYAAADTVESINKSFIDHLLPEIKKKNPHKIMKEITSLTTEQKAELKKVHDYAFGNEKISFLSFNINLEPGEAVYEHQEYRVGKITTKCIGATTLINYIPLTFVICEDKTSEDWRDLDKKIRDYTKSIIKLNSDEIR